jgi:lipopolysaccharide assembly outer membrane protein LptD (OstA)
MPVGAFATQEHHTSISLHSNRGDELSLSEEYDRDDTQTTYGRTRIKLVKGFEVLAEARYDFEKRRFEFIRQGIGYSAQCWGVTLRYDVEPAWEDELSPSDNRDRKTTVGLTVTLRGLGDMRTSYRMSN